MNYFTQALYAIYPQIAYTRGDEAFDIENNVVDYDPVVVQVEADKLSCKAQATSILQATDWTTIPDVANPANNPYLTNQAEFISYRNVIRGYAVNPVVDPVWPTAPTVQWSS